MIKPTLWNTLYRLSEFEAHRRTVRFSTVRLAQVMRTSQQTASRHLNELEKRGFISKEASFRGVDVRITKKGLEELRRVYLRLKKIIEGMPREIILEGTLFTGFGDGSYYMDQNGYKLQFETKLGFNPYPGTLNLKLSPTEIRKKKELETYPPIILKGFKSGKRSFGEVRCYPATINDVVKGAVIIIKRTHHDDSVLELIAPVYLRKRLNIEEGDEVKVKVLPKVSTI